MVDDVSVCVLGFGFWVLGFGWGLRLIVFSLSVVVCPRDGVSVFSLFFFAFGLPLGMSLACSLLSVQSGNVCDEGGRKAKTPTENGRSREMPPHFS